MTDDELKAQGPPLKFDNSMRSSFESCPRSFMWWRRGYTYNQESKPAFFVFGSAWGIMQGVWHDSPGPHSSLSDSIFADCAQLALDAGLLYWDHHSPVEKARDTRANLYALFTLYLETYQMEPFSMVKGGAEKGWLYPLEHTPYYLGGSTDGYLMWEGIGTLIKEDKTTSIYLNDKYIRQWRFANQITGYIWYHSKLSDEPGCLVNMASKQITKAGKTPQFTRVLERRSPLELKEFERDWLFTIHKIEDCWAQWIWPKTHNPINCTGGIGKSACLYQNLCLSDLPYQIIDPLTFPGIKLDETPWAPWEWKNPLHEITGAIANKNENRSV